MYLWMFLFRRIPDWQLLKPCLMNTQTQILQVNNNWSLSFIFIFFIGNQIKCFLVTNQAVTSTLAQEDARLKHNLHELDSLLVDLHQAQKTNISAQPSSMSLFYLMQFLHFFNYLNYVYANKGSLILKCKSCSLNQNLDHRLNEKTQNVWN